MLPLFVYDVAVFHPWETLQLRLIGQALCNFWRFYCWKKHGADVDFHRSYASSV